MKNAKEKNTSTAKIIRNRPVRRKLQIMAYSLSLGIIFILGIGILSLWMVNRQAKSMSNHWLISVEQAEDLNVLTSDYRIKQYGHIVSQSAEEHQSYEAQIAEIDSQIDEKAAAYQAAIRSEEQQQLFDAADAAWKDYLEISTQIIALSNAGDSAAAAELIVGEARDYYNAFLTNIDALVEYSRLGSESAAQAANSTFIFSIILMLVVAVFVLYAGSVISRIVVLNITAPLENIKTAIQKVREGNLSAVDLQYEAKDEFGTLTANINDFLSELIFIINDEKAILQEMSGGNFDVASASQQYYVGDFKAILDSMAGIKHRLGNALSNIQSSSEQVSQASDQVASAAQVLAAGASQQAAGIEEIVALVSTAQEKAVGSASHAQEASRDADHVKAQAALGSDRMTQMMGEMETLSETSKKIETIIHSIEEIASQTNLLSLNASIEAARAGEAGRGFAVVAGEIGQLANQSAEAATNTRNLIQKSIAEVANSNRIAKETAESFYAVTDGIEKVVQLNDMVKADCENQADAMKEVDARIEDISSVVQHNSAAAEESSATSEELSAHSENLAALLRQFRFAAEDTV